MLDINLICFGYIARLPSGEEEGILLVQLISTCLRCTEEGGRSTPCKNDKALLPFLPLVLFLDLTREDVPFPLQKGDS